MRKEAALALLVAVNMFGYAVDTAAYSFNKAHSYRRSARGLTMHNTQPIYQSTSSPIHHPTS
jgi:hypothetical protein